ncbi:MAG: MCE family protein [Planctomycetes bacterium]|nr:MCE family protein [Planctomycetota bacterium]
MTNTFDTKKFKLGLFFFAGLLLLGFFTLTVKDITLFEKSYYIDVIFDNTGGLKTGDAVQILGMDLGTVHEITLHEGKIRTTLKITQSIDIYANYEITSEELSAIGGRFVLIIPGTPDKPKVDLSLPIRGRATAGFSALGKAADESKNDLAQILQNISAITNDIKDAKGTMGKLIEDPSLHDELRKTLAEMRQAISDAQTTIADINQGKGTLGKLVTDSKFYDDAAKTAADIREIAENVKSGKGVIGGLLSDEQMALEIKQTVTEIKGISESVKKISEKIEKGEGSLGKFINESSLYDKAGETLDSANKILGPAARMRVDLGAEYKIFVESDESISKVFLKIFPNEDRYFKVGASFMNIANNSPLRFENQVERDEDQLFMKPELLLAWDVLNDRYNFRVGLLEGKIGGALDYNFIMPIADHPATATFEIRDAYNSLYSESLNERVHGPMARLELSTAFWEEHIRVYAGLNRLFNDGEFYGGLMFEYTDKDIKSLVALIGLGN